MVDTRFRMVVDMAVEADTLVAGVVDRLDRPPLEEKEVPPVVLVDKTPPIALVDKMPLIELADNTSREGIVVAEPERDLA